MSLYNQIFGTNEVKALLITLLDLDESKVGRFRDIHISQEEETVPSFHINVFTRLGGGNREHHEENIKYLRSVPGYQRDWDDEFDSTYATFLYVPKEGLQRVLHNLFDNTNQTPPMEKFLKMIEDLKNDNDDNSDVLRAKDFGVKLAKKLANLTDGGTVNV